MSNSKKILLVDDVRPSLKELLEKAGGKILTTPAQTYGGKGQILNERPEGMSYEEYRLKRRLQTKAIKNLLR